MANVINLGYRDWVDQFRPINNPEPDASAFAGILFETYGQDLLFVHAAAAKNPKQVWTLVQEDLGDFIIEGLHLCQSTGLFCHGSPGRTRCAI